MYPSIPASWSCTGNLYRYLPASSLSLFMDRSRNARRKWNMATLTFYSYELSQEKNSFTFFRKGCDNFQGISWNEILSGEQENAFLVSQGIGTRGKDLRLSKLCGRDLIKINDILPQNEIYTCRNMCVQITIKLNLSLVTFSICILPGVCYVSCHVLFGNIKIFPSHGRQI